MEYCNPGLWRSIVPFFTVLFSSACVCGGIQVRLDPGPNYGNVEMYHNGTWQRACLESFNYFGRNVSHVLCKQLGFNTTRNVAMPQTGKHHGLFWHTGSNCSRGERHLSQCHVGIITNRTSCYGYNIPRIACLSDNETRVDIANHNITVADGLRFSTSCYVYTPHTGFSYHWNHNWKNVSYPRRHFHGKANRTEAGNLTCSVSLNGKTLGSDSTVINVIYPPSIQCEEIVRVANGQSRTVQCKVDSYPRHHMMTWTLATTAGTRTQSSHRDTYHIVNASAGDEGNYTCRATNNLTYPDGQVETGTGTCVIKVKVTSPSGGRSAAESAAKGAPDQETTTSSAVWGGLALVAIVVIGLLVAVIVLVIRHPYTKEVPNGDKPIEMTTVNRAGVAAISGPLYENAQDHRLK
ncbi:uncharacterized protein LOC124128704 isoform X4 [Haliotis rufescens]|uniref:uncharacterized protein LOC124128704 isoform X4 n=1 Tax=Haliotis rufescens TaxID=6454 RepID=UPI00201F7266|nr:uncharacterized protein LOC124128704 isoform X4 [Haliotis rufescens]